MLLTHHIQNICNKGLSTVRRLASNMDTNSILNLIGTIFIVLAIFAVVIAIILLCITIMPLLIVWAINILAPIFGSTMVIPYSLPVLFAIYVVLWVLTIIFKRGNKQ